MQDINLVSAVNDHIPSEILSLINLIYAAATAGKKKNNIFSLFYLAQYSLISYLIQK